MVLAQLVVLKESRKGKVAGDGSIKGSLAEGPERDGASKQRVQDDVSESDADGYVKSNRRKSQRYPMKPNNFLDFGQCLKGDASVSERIDVLQAA
jgi:hypothetical protein